MLESRDDAPTQNERPTVVRHFVLAWLSIAAAIAYIQRNSLSVLESTVRDDLGLSERQMGLVMGSFFLTYGVFQIPGGWLGDRWGSRRVLPLLSSLWSLATVLTAIIGWWLLSMRDDSSRLPIEWIMIAWVGLLIARLLSGGAQAGIFPCSAVVIHTWFPGTRWAGATGWLSAFQQVGAVLAAFLTGKLVGLRFEWPMIFFLFSLPGFLWALYFFRWFRDQPREHSSVNSAELELVTQFKHSIPPPAQEASSGGTGALPASVDARADKLPVASDAPTKEPVPWKLLLTSWPMWAFCTQQFFRAAAYMFYASWFPTYLQQTRGISVERSGVLTSLPVAATFLGTVIGGVISDRLLVRTGSRRIARQGLAFVGLILSAGLILAGWFVKAPVPAVLVISAGSFCAAVAGPVSYALSIEMGGRHVSTVFGAMNMSGSIGAFVFPVIVPLVREATGSWDSVLVMFALIYLAAAVCWLLFNPSGTVFDRPGRQPASD